MEVPEEDTKTGDEVGSWCQGGSRGQPATVVLAWSCDKMSMARRINRLSHYSARDQIR